MKNTIFLFIFLFTGVFCLAQQKPAAKTANTTLPKLTVMLGGSKSGNISVIQLQNIVDSPLIVKDEKGVIISIKKFSHKLYFQEYIQG